MFCLAFTPPPQFSHICPLVCILAGGCYCMPYSEYHRKKEMKKCYIKEEQAKNTLGLLQTPADFCRCSGLQQHSETFSFMFCLLPGKQH